MTYLNWGCDPLAAECQSCLDAICNACEEGFRKMPAPHHVTYGEDDACRDEYEPDCDSCDLEKKPACSGCEIILQVCMKCSEQGTCEFSITGNVF